MDFGTVFEIIVVFFAMFGMIYFGKLIIDRFFMPRNIILSATVFDEKAAENIDILIEILKNNAKNKDICILINQEMSNNEELMERLHYSEIMFYIV